jgi:hypothetical protein
MVASAAGFLRCADEARRISCCIAAYRVILTEHGSAFSHSLSRAFS